MSKKIESLAILPRVWDILSEKATKVCENAYAPYSKYKVGCALELEDGTIVTGANQENASYPLSMCAERIAVFTAKSQYPKLSITKLLITINRDSPELSPIAPCGACRQVIYEAQTRQETQIEIISGSKSAGYHHFHSAEALLPHPFGPQDLKKAKH